MGTCPKCGFNRRAEDKECPRCGVVYKKYEAIEKKKAAEIRAKTLLEEAARQSEKLRKQSAEKQEREHTEKAEKHRQIGQLYKIAKDLQKKGDTSQALEKYYELKDLYPNTKVSLAAEKQIRLIKKGLQVKFEKERGMVPELETSKTRKERTAKKNELGTVLIICGIIALIYSLSMDTTLPTTLGKRVYNIGLMNQKQNYIIVSALILLIGVIITAFRKLRAGSISSEETIYPETKQCPYCAEQIKLEALICRYCGRKQPLGNVKDEFTEEDGRILCPDGSCIGLIDHDGRCSECGRIFKTRE